jgi:hypothetical protein
LIKINPDNDENVQDVGALKNDGKRNKYFFESHDENDNSGQEYITYLTKHLTVFQF